jgi:TFIIF-interacting CTD phosphatase-like protein
MGRDINKVIIIDNSPHSFAFQPENAIPCDSWFDDMDDHELYDLLPILEGLADDAGINLSIMINSIVATFYVLY